MQGFIAFIMQGRVQAILFTALSALLALLVTPIAIISMAILVLATLRNGVREGLVVVISATLVLAGFGGLLFQMPIPFVLLGITLWLPAWGLASLLGNTRSLAKSLSAAALGGFFIVGLQYLLLDAPIDVWRTLLQEFMQAQLNAMNLPAAEQSQLVDMLAQWMPGGVAASWFTSIAMALFLGRWAAFKLDGGDGLSAEFRNLRFERFWLILLPVLMLPMILFDSGPGISSQLYLVGMMLFLLQGISVAHAFAHQYQANRIWLFSFYMVLFIGAPYSTLLVAMLGYVDGWLDFRAKAGIQSQNQ